MPAQPITYNDAIDTVFGIVNGAWAGSQNILGYIPQIRWQGKEVAAKPPVNLLWARVSAQIITDQLASLAGVDGKRLYHAEGLVYVQFFAPRTDPSLKLARQLAQYIREFFRKESSDGNMWFKNAKIVELQPTSTAYPINLSANFEYDNTNGQVNTNPLLLALQRGGKHSPVEAVDGTRSQFTFLGLPANQNFYLIILGPGVQNDFVQNGQIIDFGVIIPAGTALYGIY